MSNNTTYRSSLRDGKLSRWLLTAMPIVLLVLLTACSTAGTPVEEEMVAESSEDAEQQEEAEGEEVPTRGQGGTLRMLFWQAPTTMNPHLSPGTKDLSAARITYEPLASFDKEGVMVPILAAESPSLENGGFSEDGRSVTWTLKEGVLWSDGEQFTADDVLFTYEYVTNPDVAATSAGAYAGIESVEVIDDTTVKVTFIEPTPAWYAPFVGPFGMIVPRHVFEDYNGSNAAEAPANLAPVGTGPFRVVEYIEEDILIIGSNAVSTNKIMYEANPHFRDPGKPFFATIELQGGGDLDLAAQAAQEGLVDFAWNMVVAEETMIEMDAAGKVRVIPTPSSFVERIMLNFSDPNSETPVGERSSVENPHPFMSDKSVRQAIAMAIDREAIAEPYGRGGNLTTNILVEPVPYNSLNTVYEYNPEAAATLLEEAGWIDSDGDGVREKDEVELEVVFQTSIQVLRQRTQEQVKRDLEAIGFRVDLKQIDASIFFGPPENTTDTRRQFYADFEEFAFSNKSPDPTAYMAAWVCDEAAQMADNWSKPNWSRYCNPEVDAVFEQTLTEFDPDRRAELWIEMNDLLIEDVAVIPLAHLFNAVAVGVDIQGADFTAWDVEVWNVGDWYRE
jgi:peptide/nickel transport system substrate-binding protein